MRKMDIIKEIHEAKRAHISWVSHAQALIIGLPLEENQVPKHSTECKFGQWYYGHGQILKRLPAFNAIEEPHMQLHEAYMRIFHLLFGEAHKEEKQGFFSRLFGKSSTAAEDGDKKTQVETLFRDLKHHSETVIKLLDKLESQIEALADHHLKPA